MAPSVSLLNQLQSQTMIDCDTCNVEVPKSLGPFEDCTANQAIAYAELQEPRNEPLIERSMALSRFLLNEFRDVTLEELAVEVSMVSLALQIVPYIRGSVHVQSNPFHAYSTAKQVGDGRRIVRLFQYLDPKFDISRVCIKIPSTWEGLQACRTLEGSGTRTLATTLFSIEQAALAGEVGCHYIAPYINELKVHIDKEYHDLDPQLQLCVFAQWYYEHNCLPTKVLPASLTSIQEIMALAGVHHITIAPPLLEELASISPDSTEKIPSLFAKTELLCEESLNLMRFGNDEAAFRMAFTRRDNGKAESKLIQALNIFCDMQQSLEKMMRGLCEADT